MKYFIKNNGTLWNTLGSTMYGLNSFIMLAMVSRFSTVEEAGTFGIAFTTAQLLYIVGLFGVSHYQMTDYQKIYSFYDYAKVRAFSCCLMLAACVGSIIILHFSNYKALFTVLLSMLMMLNVVGDLYQNLFFQNNRLDLSGSALFYRTFWPLIVFCLTLMFTRQVIWAIVLQVVCNLMVTLYYIRSVAPSFLREESHNGRQHDLYKLLLDCIPLFVSLLLMNVVINASKYGIEFLMDDRAQGYYNMIFMPAQVINLCSQFVFKPMLKGYSSLLHGHKIAEFCRLILKQLGMILAFTILCCVGAYFLGVPVLGLLYQKDLYAQVYSLVLVVLGGGIFAACQLFYYIVVIMRKQNYIAYIYMIATIASIPATYALVMKQGIFGAAMSFVVVHLVILLLYLCLIGSCFKRETE